MGFHPKHDTLIIQGFAPTTRDLIPWGRGDFDFAALNEGYNYPWMKKEPDLWFQMHPRWDFTRPNNANHLNHPNWIFDRSGVCMRCLGAGELDKKEGGKEKCPECDGGTYTPPAYRAGLPIVMQKAWDDVPNSIRFPLKEASDLFGLGYPYFTSSVAFMLAYAYLVGYKKVELYGFEMGTQTEYHYQRANGEFIIGFLKAKGMDIYLPPACGILKGELYGYRNMKTGFRQNLELRRVVLEGQEQKAIGNVNRLTGQIELLQEFQALASQSKDIKLEDFLNAKAQEFDTAKNLRNTIKGAIAETKNLTALHDGFYHAGTESGDLEEVSGEDFAAFTNTEYTHV